MPQYLSKEEIKQWRSSLEKITLEEFAYRLGKSIETEKHTKDIVDMVMKSSPMSMSSYTEPRSSVEKIQSIAKRAVEVEKQIYKPLKQITKTSRSSSKRESKPILKQVANQESASEYSFKKALTAREQAVFEYFLSNQNNIVYAKDLAKILDLPRDYVYKYIKNLRNKIEGGHLKNADNGGYVLSI